MKDTLGFFGSGLKSLRQYGLGLAAKVILHELFYEAKFRSRTSRLIAGDDLDIDEELKRHGSPHLPSPYYFARRAFGAVNGGFAGRAFVDFGCGLGRVLLFASQFPFARVIGVEASPKLCAEATLILARYYARKRKTAPEWSVVCADATRFPIPPDGGVFYFGDPFGPPILDPVVRNIAASQEANPRPISVVYVHPAHPGVFLGHGFRVLASEVNPRGRGYAVLAR